MTKLDDHYAKLKDLIDNCGITYASRRVAEAMLDVIEHLTAAPKVPDDFGLPLYSQRKQYESRIHELENTINQLKEHNKGLKREVSWLLDLFGADPAYFEQSGCRKDDTQVDGWIPWSGPRLF